MNRVDKDKVVAFAYKLTDTDNGKVLFEATKDAPDVLLYGRTQDVVPGLAAALKGLAAGDKFSVELPAEAAFGPRYEENVMTLPKKDFLIDGKFPEQVKPGAVIPMQTDRGMIIRGNVVEVTPENVVMDFNHPFAGKNVKYEGEVTEVRDATEDELNPKGCCGGCGGGCEGGDGCDSCGDGCGGCQ